MSIVGVRALFQPVTLASIKIKSDIIDSIGRPALSILLLGILQLLPEDVVVGVFADFVNDNLLQVVRNFVDDVFCAILAQLQVVKRLNTVRMDRKSAGSQVCV